MLHVTITDTPDTAPSYLSIKCTKPHTIPTEPSEIHNITPCNPINTLQ